MTVCKRKYKSRRMKSHDEKLLQCDQKLLFLNNNSKWNNGLLRNDENKICTSLMVNENLSLMLRVGKNMTDYSLLDQKEKNIFCFGYLPFLESIPMSELYQ